MALFKRTVAAAAETTVTAEEAIAIYNYLKDGLSETEIFTQKGFDLKKTKIVLDEAKRLEKEVNIIMNQEEQPETEEALITLVSSDILDVSVIIPDIRAWSDGNPDDAPDWATYKASFTEGE